LIVYVLHDVSLRLVFRRGSDLTDFWDDVYERLARGQHKEAILAVIRWKGRVSSDYPTRNLAIRPAEALRALRELEREGKVREEEW